MKAKLLLLMMTVGLLLTIPQFSFAQGMTDEDLEIEGGDTGNSDWGPVSFNPTLIEGVLSHVNQTITVNFLEDLGTVTIWIVDEKGTLYYSEEVNSAVETTKVLDLKALPAQKYRFVFYNPVENQKADFELHK